MDFKLFKQGRWAKSLVLAAGAVLVLWGAAWLVVPPLIKSQLEKLGSEQLGRKVSLGVIDFKPWSLELTVHDLAVARADGAPDRPPQLLVKRIYIDAELQSLVRLAPVVDAIELEAPHLNLTHLGAGRYDVDDILTRLSARSRTPTADPLSFALYNLALSGGSLDFVDQSVHKTHELRDLQIKVPFLSNLASQRTVLVQPQLAFRLNGSRFDSSALGTPFAQTRKTDANFKLADLDLAPYLGYVPASLPIRLKSALLNVDLKVAFEQSPQMAVRLSGTVQAVKVSMASAGQAVNISSDGSTKGGDELLDFDSLKLSLTDVRPLEYVAHLGTVDWDGPRLTVLREQSGRLSLAKLLPSQRDPQTPADKAGNTGAGGQNVARPNGWKLDVAKVNLRRGAVNWIDDGTRPQARLGLRDLALEASGIALPWVRPVQFGGSASLVSATGPERSASLRFQGSATDQVANAMVTVGDLPLGMADPYLAGLMALTLGGTLNAELGVNWKAGADRQKPAELMLEARQLTLDDVTLARGATSLASVKKLQLERAAVDLDRQSVTADKLSVFQPKARVGREADGRWMYQSWLKTVPAAGHKMSSSDTLAGDPSSIRGKRITVPVRKPASPAKGWAVAVNDMSLQGGAVSYFDHAVGKPVAFELSALSVQLKNFSTAGSEPFGVNVSTQIRAGRSESGRLDWRGSAGLSPMAVQGWMAAVRVPVHAFEPYLADALNIELLKAEASFKGQLSYAQKPAGPVFKISGDTAIEDFQSNTIPIEGAATAPDKRLTIGEELLSWKVLALRGLEVAVAPGTATSVTVRETVLSDFFSRIILSEAGRLNLQDVIKSPAQADVPALASVAGVPSASASDAAKTIGTDAVATGTKGSMGSETALPPVIRFGPVSVTGGRVAFSDRFIQPNYSANLTELTGKLSAFSSQTEPGLDNLADLELRGRAEGTASLEILGKVNPLLTPVALDIKGRVRDLELPPLSPYSVRYAGYGIERGKLSVDVGYLVLPNGQLTASNNIVLNQLTFGDKADGATATLPVKLAVALLADRNGVIDINLPVSGSLNDPQFKLAPIVFKLIVNLIVKAITSPFSLLASAFGGGADELSVVNFTPGSAILAPQARPGLDKVAKALIERPALKMTVVGTASLEVERDAFKRERLNALVRAEKRRAALVSGASVQSLEAEAVDVTAAEYPVLLKAVYRRADFPKPRNLLGMAKDIPPNEMEALLLAHLAVTEDAMRELAVQRGVTVRDYLVAQKLPSDRLFLGAAKAVSAEAKWSPRAELNLGTR